MNQPELGKKIAELRKSRGLTQEELVEKCNISVRTLQRIEAGEVMPRIYTLRLIFTTLDHDIDESLELKSSGFEQAIRITSYWLGQCYVGFVDLFNLKTKKMKKIVILSVMFASICFGLFALTTESQAQKKTEKAIKAIEKSSIDLKRWINNGHIDSLMSVYRKDATVLPAWSGKDEIREMIESALADNYRLVDFRTLSISVGDSIAVQKYWNVSEIGGTSFNQMGLTEWRLTNGIWLIVNDAMVNY